LLAASRKGLFVVRGQGALWEITSHHFAGDPVTQVMVDPRNANHLTVAVSCGGVWQTTDAGQSWLRTADGMKADYLPPDSAQDPNTQDPHRLVQCAAQPDVLWVQHHCGLYRSTNAGHRWVGIPAPAPSGFGFAVACDPQNPLRAWFVPAQADTRRCAVDGKMVVMQHPESAQLRPSWQRGL
jgi:hypothetical protein